MFCAHSFDYFPAHDELQSGELIKGRIEASARLYMKIPAFIDLQDRAHGLSVYGEGQHRAVGDEGVALAQPVKPILRCEATFVIDIGSNIAGQCDVRPVGPGCRRDFEAEIEVVVPYFCAQQ